MSFPIEITDHSKVNCSQKCLYLMNLIKHKSEAIWEMYRPVYETLNPEESWEFYNTLVNEYRLLLATPVKKVAKKAVRKTSVRKKAA